MEDDLDTLFHSAFSSRYVIRLSKLDSRTNDFLGFGPSTGVDDPLGGSDWFCANSLYLSRSASSSCGLSGEETCCPPDHDDGCVIGLGRSSLSCEFERGVASVAAAGSVGRRSSSSEGLVITLKDDCLGNDASPCTLLSDGVVLRGSPSIIGSRLCGRLRMLEALELWRLMLALARLCSETGRLGACETTDLVSVFCEGASTLLDGWRGGKNGGGDCGVGMAGFSYGDPVPARFGSDVGLLGGKNAGGSAADVR